MGAVRKCERGWGKVELETQRGLIERALPGRGRQGWVCRTGMLHYVLISESHLLSRDAAELRLSSGFAMGEAENQEKLFTITHQRPGQILMLWA